MATLKISVDTAEGVFDAHLEAFPEVVTEMLEGAGEIVVRAWKSDASSIPHRKNGYMIDNTEAKIGLKKNDVYRCVKIYPRRKDPDPKKYMYSGSSHTKKPVTNAVKAFLLNYGTMRDGKTRIKGDHWVEHAREWSDPKALAEMERIWKKFTETF
jgi:hypothetical protein